MVIDADSFGRDNRFAKAVNSLSRASELPSAPPVSSREGLKILSQGPTAKRGLHMPDQQTTRLQNAIREVAAKVQKYQDRNLGEQNTKASLIEPMLEALGWDIRDPDEVHREFKPTTQDKPVDYCLTLLRKPRLLVEAKGLGETLSDRRWIGQILGYAAVAGVEWCVLTDGNEYRFYNATVALDAEEKLFFQIRLADGPAEEAAEIMKLVSQSNMKENILESIWKSHYVDRRVKQALREMFEGRDRGLIRLIRRKVSKLTPKEIAESLRRLDVRIESITPVPASGRQAQATPPLPRKGARRRRQEEKAKYDVRLADLIAASLLSPPVRLFRKYKGKMMEATLLPDGAVEFGQVRYRTCSTAAETARSTITGRKMHTNGWSFWQFLDTEGKTSTLAAVRKAFLARKGG
jgi:predicted type IV restriction endonuclease